MQYVDSTTNGKHVSNLWYLQKIGFCVSFEYELIGQFETDFENILRYELEDQIGLIDVKARE
jgi:hypothetical protein